MKSHPTARVDVITLSSTTTFLLTSTLIFG